MVKTYLKVHKDNCSRLRKSLSLEAFACLEVCIKIIVVGLESLYHLKHLHV
jgi:hypothetical protein